MNNSNKITNLPLYIEETEEKIQILKQKDRRKYIQFTIAFQNDNLLENFKRYFLNKGYGFSAHKCKLGNWDYEISW